MKVSIYLAVLLVSSFAWASGAPTCMADGSALAVNNDQVANWKHSTQNDFHARGHVTGLISKLYPDKTGHNHFEIQLDGTNDTLEVVYNEGSGAIPSLHTGSAVEACGDYITSYQYDGHYQPSPDGALIHWVHKSDTPRHDSGFLIIDGVESGD